MSYQRISGPPVLVDRRSYGNLPPRAMGGFWDTLESAAKGASDIYQSTKNSSASSSAPAAPPVYAPPPQESSFQKYLPVIAIGGLALVGVVLLRRK
jgi:hypothetical protein